MRKLLSSVLSRQRFAVLATEGDGAPYTNLVAYACNSELDALVFLTPRETKKFSNIIGNPQVSLFVDNISNQPEDIQSAVGISIAGIASVIDDDLKGKYLKNYLERHPYLEDFAWADGNALIRVEVEQYTVVSNFSRVEEFDPRSPNS